MNYFITVEKLSCLYELLEIEKSLDKIYNHFMNTDDEICYILDQGDIYGIITIGDMYRFYRNENTREDIKSSINRKFSYVETENDYEGAQKIFNKIDTIHEVPVIVNNKLKGVIRIGDNVIYSRDKMKHILYDFRMGKECWRQKEIEKICKKLEANIYFYNVPAGKLDMFNLCDDEKKLYNKKRKYPSGASGLLMMTETEQKLFWGDYYSKQYIQDFYESYRKIKGTIKNGIYRIEDQESKCFNFKNGYRNIPIKNQKTNKKIFLFGPCIVVGAYVEDSLTIESYLQQLLIDNGYYNYEVINCGLFGPEYALGRVFTEKISRDDIVIIIDNFEGIYEYHNKSTKDIFSQNYKGNLLRAYKEIDNVFNNVFNAMTHCNHIVNNKIADIIFDDIEKCLIKDNSKAAPREAIQDYYIPWEIHLYFKEYIEKYHLKKEIDQTVGAIVMNCNPFTKGHRYLIEYACKKVDLLYVFVVEEDKSYYKFEDRIEMVRRGTKDLENVVVLPSGKYILSQETFKQYFEKDNVEQVDNMDYDLHIFGEVVAQYLGISYRFVGEEPIDKVTRKYNETMKHILLNNGVEVVEIPRKLTEEGNIISASAVRKAIQNKCTDELKKMLPASTMEYLKLNIG